MADETQDRVTLQLDSSLSCVAKVEETALRFAQAAGFDPDTASNLAMVTREAAANAVMHGNRYSADKHIAASFEISPEALTIAISDEGEGVDPDSIPDPLAPENLLRASGRGVFLMRAFMDQVSFRNLNPGTEITLVKRRPSAQPSS